MTTSVPGFRVLPSITYSEAELADMTDDPIVIGGGGSFAADVLAGEGVMV